MAHFRRAVAEETQAPWHVEVKASQLSSVVGPNDTILKRIGKVVRCELSVNHHSKKKLVKAMHVGGQTQYYDAGDEEEGNKLVKIYIRGGPEQRIQAAELIQEIANGEDAEVCIATADGSVMFEHTVVHPDKVAWARWRLASVAHEYGATGHIGKDKVCVSAKGGGSLKEDVAEKVQEAAQAVLDEAEKLVEIVVDAMDKLEPEDAPTDPAIEPLIEQHGVIVRVCDQDDNVVSDIIKVRLIGPSKPVKDAEELVKARFIQGHATASVLQALEQVQGMDKAMSADFARDLNSLMEECKVQVHTGSSVIWITGASDESVGEAKKMLQEMLQFYLGDDCEFLEGLQPVLIDRLLEDEDIGTLMTQADCALAVDESQRAAWICGKRTADVKRRIDILANLPAPQVAEGAPPMKKRRKHALTVHSGEAPTEAEG